MATILAKLAQKDNGLSVTIEDVTQWADTANTGVTHVTISVTNPDATVTTVIDEDVDQPAAQADLTWEILGTDVGFTDVFDDGIYTFTITYTTTPASDPINAVVFLDWNLKYYDFQLVKNLTYKLENTQFAYNQDVENSMVFDALRRGVQYNAAVGQTTKVNYILEVIEKFKKTQ